MLRSAAAFLLVCCVAFFLIAPIFFAIEKDRYPWYVGAPIVAAGFWIALRVEAGVSAKLAKGEALKPEVGPTHPAAFESREATSKEEAAGDFLLRDE